MEATQDIVIIGGGVIGSSIAYFLKSMAGFDGIITVLEKDPSYEFGSTARSWGGVRQQFSTPENILMSQFMQEFLGQITHHLAIDDTPVDVGYREYGYLFLAEDRHIPLLYTNNAIQRKLGVNVGLLDSDDLARGYPWMNVSDLAGGSLGLSGEGRLDAYSLNQAFRKKSISLGVRFLKAEAIGLEVEAKQVSAVLLKDGSRLRSGYVVNAAGPTASEVAGWAGIDLPVRSRKRFAFSFSCRTEVSGCPLVIDPSGVHFSPEGRQFIAGCSPDPENDPDCSDFEIDYGWFEEHIWPILAHRVPAFESIKLENAWAGHYAYNILDQNAILGSHPEITNFFFANGFSGHGLQQSPAVGHAIAELITHGEYRTLDLSRLSFSRVTAGDAILERNIV
ncbi:FAD-binding oxidoreductase [uncultured Sneathiella sp.]|jgi:glycine/D-amino acid oxidase-like deaminating enzyme|uniref:NAD(P)/FAD-dependent oxidoreductase n=1 Tax=uncultured Sneathiella sp. TaxID=879315 RepID=UPI0030D70992|tara:strand:+ start:15171 stop:16349 length:1179 start_codon:yes stop_codon:yes gene_type:complete